MRRLNARDRFSLGNTTRVPFVDAGHRVRVSKQGVQSTPQSPRRGSKWKGVEFCSMQRRRHEAFPGAQRISLNQSHVPRALMTRVNVSSVRFAHAKPDIHRWGHAPKEHRSGGAREMTGNARERLAHGEGCFEALQKGSRE